MIYLGLDLSTNCTGWAIFEDGKLKCYGKIVPLDHLSINAIQKTIYIANNVKKLMEKFDPNTVVIEDTHYDKRMGYEPTRVLNRLAGAVIYVIETSPTSHGLTDKDRILFLQPSETRRRMGILPKATNIKRRIVDAVNLKFGLGLKPSEHDEADAIVTGYAGFAVATDLTVDIKKNEQAFYKTKVRGLKTPPIKGAKKRGSKN